MKLDLERLREMHPALPSATADAYAHRAALALGRRHAPGVAALVTIDAESVAATLSWEARPAADALQLDYHRVTEDGAEAVALALVHASRSWMVLRRLQREEHADWLLRETATRRLVALEVSGTDEGDGDVRLSAKLTQVAQSTAARRRAACVVGFLEPRIALAIVREAPR
jgi:hypothetical protein